MILDVGCGDRPKGNVNLDCVHSQSSDFFESERKINPKRAPNFVLGDAYHLPFRNNAFETVLCHHTLEHLENPVSALKELVRVTSNTLEIIVPFRSHEKIQNRFMPKRKHWAEKHHKWFFTKKELQRVFRDCGFHPTIKYSWKIVTSLKYFSRFHMRSFKQLILYGFLDFLPPTPGELIATVTKIPKPIIRAK